MSLLSYNRLCELIEQGVIQGAKFEDVNSSSIDIHLGANILEEASCHAGSRLSLRDRDKMPATLHQIPKAGYVLFPGEFILAQSQELFNLPNNISAEYKLKSSMARIGLEHMNAGWCDAGWHGSVLTLEFKNMLQHSSIILREGDKIGQVIFFEHESVPAEKSYATRGRYNQDKTVTGIKE